jgi:4-carboxymuconolactone decarboxylase
MWNAHHEEALDLGFSTVELARLASGEDPDLDDASERALWRFGSELLKNRAVSDGAYSAALDAFGEESLLDIVGCLGSFTMSCYALTAFRVAIHPERGWPFPDLPAEELTADLFTEGEGA